MSEYNGWSNWETWNCALWVGNSETLTLLAEKSISYDDFIAQLKHVAGGADLSEMTPDGARWEDADYSEMNDLIMEIQ
jgi:hypothetical protein